jgi:hypothetical protein
MCHSRSKSKFAPYVIGTVLALAVFHQAAASLWPGFDARAYSVMVTEPPSQQIVDRSHKGDPIASIQQVTKRDQKPTAVESEQGPSAPPPAARSRIPVGCEAAVSPLALRTSVSARCLS